MAEEMTPSSEAYLMDEELTPEQLAELIGNSMFTITLRDSWPKDLHVAGQSLIDILKAYGYEVKK